MFLVIRVSYRLVHCSLISYTCKYAGTIEFPWYFIVLTMYFLLYLIIFCLLAFVMLSLLTSWVYTPASDLKRLSAGLLVVIGPAELLQIIFHSFKAGIANAISSFKWRKIFIFVKNKPVPKWSIWVIEHLPLNILSISVAFYLGLIFLENVYIRVEQDYVKLYIYIFRSNKRIWVWMWVLISSPLC